MQMTQRLNYCLSRVFLVVLVSLAGSGVAWSQAAQKIAVVDVNIVMRDSSAASGLRAQIKNELDKFRKWGKSREDKYIKEGEALQKQQSVLAQDVLRERQRGLQKKVAAFQVEARNREQKIRRAGATAQQELDKLLVAVVSDVAKKQGLTLVLPRNVLIYSGAVQDVTKETVAQLNKKMPKLGLKVPK